MPEVRRGSLVPQSPTESTSHNRRISQNSSAYATPLDLAPLGSVSSDPAPGAPTQPRAQSLDISRLQQHTRPSTSIYRPPPRVKTEGGEVVDGRRSLSYAQRPAADAYYDSRAGTHREWKRRAKTLQEYYDENPHLLPQLPFTFHHGKKRWKLIFFLVAGILDASAVPILLYYAMNYGGHVEGYIIFAIVTTIWGGPAYVEAALRTLRLIKKERFYRPLGTDSRWSFDFLTWVLVLTIGTVTTLFIVGSAPHIVWLRVLTMPGPAILYCLGGSLGLVTLYHAMEWKAPFRISSTAKGEKVLPGLYYFMEDIMAVNAKAGRPYREALAARYQASPRFQRLLYVQSIFWAVPSVILAAGLTVVAVIHPVPSTVAYGVCWAVPFIWAVIWGCFTMVWCRRAIARERMEWEKDEAAVARLSGLKSEGGSAEAGVLGIKHEEA